MTTTAFSPQEKNALLCVLFTMLQNFLGDASGDPANVIREAYEGVTAADLSNIGEYVDEKFSYPCLVENVREFIHEDCIPCFCSLFYFFQRFGLMGDAEMFNMFFSSCQACLERPTFGRIWANVHMRPFIAFQVLISAMEQLSDIHKVPGVTSAMIKNWVSWYRSAYVDRLDRVLFKDVVKMSEDFVLVLENRVKLAGKREDAMARASARARVGVRC